MSPLLYVNDRTRTWALALALGILSSLSPLTAQAADASQSGVNCAAGSTLQEKSDGLIKKLGLIPDQVLGDRIAKTLKSAKGTSDALTEVRDLCVAAQSKDGIDAYFYALGKLSAGLPMAPYISAEINAGKAIVKEGLRIANHVAFSGFFDNLAAATYFNVTVVKKSCRWLWQRCDYYSATEIDQKVSAASILYRTASGATKESGPLWLCSDELCSNKGNGVRIYQITVGEALASEGEALTEAFLKLTWASGQVSMIALRSGAVDASGFKFSVDFAENNKWYEYAF
jgi:hypothetical protein